jgi:hypothetical protein
MNTQPNSAYSNHDEMWMLLPWYANGSLKGSELERVKAHVQVCLVCRRELASQTMLAKHLEHTPRVEISCKPSFERLMSRIREEEGIEANRNSQIQGKTKKPLNWKNWFHAHLTPQHLTAAFATGLLAIAIPLLLSETHKADIKSYHTVANQNSLDRFNQNDIRVVFADQVTEREVSNLIGSIHGNIVDGPNTEGTYTVRISDGANEGESLSQALSQLRGNKSVIFAEPALPHPGGPNKGGG